MALAEPTPNEEDEVEEEDASLDDDLLSELDAPDTEEEEDPLTVGFGEVPEEEEKAIEKAIEKEEDDDGDTENLEEDAEDVDYDTFDDVDDM